MGDSEEGQGERGRRGRGGVAARTGIHMYGLIAVCVARGQELAEDEEG